MIKNQKKRQSTLSTNIGKRIKQERLSLGLTQEKFSELLNITPNHLSDVERGIKVLSLEKLYDFSRNFHLSLDYLIAGNGDRLEEIEVDSENSEFVQECIHLLSACQEEDHDFVLSILRSIIYRLKK